MIHGIERRLNHFGTKRPANHLQIGNYNTATSQAAYKMSGTLHDVTPDPPSWKKYHTVTTQIYSEPLPQWYQYHTMTSTIGVEAWYQYHTMTSTIGVESYQCLQYHTAQANFDIIKQWNKYHTAISSIEAEVYQWIKYHTAQFTLRSSRYGFEIYHKMVSKINSFSELMHTSSIIVT